RAAAEARAALAPLRRAARAAEERLYKLTAEKAALDGRLADPALYSGNGAGVTELLKQQSALGRAIAEAEADWFAAEEALEAAAAG
ncbi:MAG: ABC transporter ATP-binding protein, partial [Alphaproteobacteria bacterium]|nr:ABC transporter ATP-binding protein [Alphaproteobacteria bacterium]